MIKEDGKYYEVSIRDLLSGFDIEKIKKLPPVKLYSGIISINQQGNVYSIMVKEDKIKQSLNIANKTKILGMYGIVGTYLCGIGVSKKADRLFIDYLSENNLIYEKRDGFILSFQMTKMSNGYNVKKESIKFSTSVENLKQNKSNALLPNVYPQAKACWGSTKLPILKDFSEVGKVFYTFLGANVNGDLSAKVLNKRRFYEMVDELYKDSDNLDEKYKLRTREILKEILVKMERETNFETDTSCSVSVYLLILLANIYKRDMDWVHKMLLG